MYKVKEVDSRPVLLRPMELTDEQRALTEFPTDHDGHAKAVQYLYGQDIRFNESLGWMYWNGAKWERNYYAVRDLVRDTLRLREGYARIQGDEYAVNTNSVNGIIKMLESYVRVSEEDFDSLDDHLPVLNGVVNLRTGELLPHDRKYNFTYTANVPFNSEADDTEWVNFLRECVNGDGQALEALHIFSGYAITGETKEEKLLYIQGPTRSGKGTYTETVQGLLPETIVAERPFSTFTADRDKDTNHFDMASLKSARIVFASESSRYQELNAAHLKVATGGNRITAAYKGKDIFTFKPQFKIILSSNETINLNPYDDAAWGRLIALTFPISHLDNPDTTLKEKFKSETMQQGVLKWIIEGAKKYYQRGKLLETDAMRHTLREQRDKLDTVSMWISECVVEEKEAFTPSSQIRESYERWCRENGVEPKRARFFTEALKKCIPSIEDDNKLSPYTKYENGQYIQDKKRQRGYLGIGLI